MSIESSEVFTKRNLDQYLRELAKEYKKQGGRNIPAEIILIGGAAIIESYGFREMTTDVDAVLNAASVMKDAINRVGDRYSLPNGWLNTDFMKTDSYSPRLRQYSVPYRIFNQVLNVRMVTGEYLIAMKLRAGRKYKNDLSDVVGILAEHETSENPITFEKIDSAVKNLYGSWEGFSQDSVSFIQAVLAAENFREMYEQIREEEIQAKGILLEFQDAYPGVLKAENVDGILERKQSKKSSILSELHQRRQESE